MNARDELIEAIAEKISAADVSNLGNPWPIALSRIEAKNALDVILAEAPIIDLLETALVYIEEYAWRNGGLDKCDIGIRVDYDRTQALLTSLRS